MGWSAPSHLFSGARLRRATLGCYVSGHMSCKHPMVQEDTTREDCALEGTFLGCDLTTPTFWLWSFSLKKPMHLEGPSFSLHLYPFRNPTMIINQGHLTLEDVEAIHTADCAIDNHFPNMAPSPAEVVPETSGSLLATCQSTSKALHAYSSSNRGEATGPGFGGAAHGSFGGAPWQTCWGAVIVRCASTGPCSG
jgi:hypothetical protein